MKKIELKKISLATIENELSREEMKHIMAGSTMTRECGEVCNSSSDCDGYCDYCRNGVCAC